MLRTALTPRYLGLLGVALVVVLAFTWLGRWQLGVAEGRAQQEAVEEARAARPVALTDVLTPNAAFPGELSSRPVLATGAYTDGQLLVPERRLDGVAGSWVLTPFVVEDTGATLPVLRGFVAEGEVAGPPPDGRRTIEGGLAPPEGAAPVETGPGEIGSVDTAVLVNEWSVQLYNGFLFLDREDPATGEQLAKVPTPLGPSGVTWRNAAYAVQWWVFALFALWMWWRMVREGHRRAEEEPSTHHGTAAPPPVASGENGAREHR
ncbi:SURF1 family protein [Phycicoccus sp. BSK3Z-2]|uniref:SURF1-like protein n=1 Tax=Phycicoccus avicenniae TaxID=2828860 RepID=A0A941HZ27_9MICO|nr:SURF1 family protein [Phycicoccus avicenniae]MBR7743618.1 SURF1 family protein [Phycicoccus avicenniae]